MNIEFSLGSYIYLLNHLRNNGFAFSTFAESSKPRGKIVLLRHDVDFDLASALTLAKVENELGIKSTFFIMLQSEFYNCLTKESRLIVNRIVELGHEIGLHWDLNGIEENREALLKILHSFKEVLSSITGLPVISASQHAPTRDMDSVDIAEIFPINTYSPKYFSEMKYLSDSAMNFREPAALIDCGSYKKIQLLIHPLWWTTPGETREEKLQSLMNKGLASLQNSFNRENQWTREALLGRSAIDPKVREVFKKV